MSKQGQSVTEQCARISAWLACLVVSFALLSGCMQFRAAPYRSNTPMVKRDDSAEGQATRYVVEKFTESPAVKYPLKCRLASVWPPTGKLFADYIADALQIELERRGQYDFQSNHVISARLESIDFSSSGELLDLQPDGHWTIKAVFTIDQHQSVPLETKFYFKLLSAHADIACSQVMIALPSAVKQLLTELIDQLARATGSGLDSFLLRSKGRPGGNTPANSQ